MQPSENFETGCCPRFNPGPWNEKQIEFKEKLFFKDHVTSIFHIPLNFGKIMKRAMENIEKAGAHNVDNLVLVDEKSLWGADIYIAVDKEIHPANIERISGVFLSKVFEGSYNDMGDFIKQMNIYAKDKHREIKKIFFYYVYCPECAKAYGKNFIVLLAQI